MIWCHGLGKRQISIGTSVVSSFTDSDSDFYEIENDLIQLQKQEDRSE